MAEKSRHVPDDITSFQHVGCYVDNFHYYNLHMLNSTKYMPINFHKHGVNTLTFIKSAHTSATMTVQTQNPTLISQLR